MARSAITGAAPGAADRAAAARPITVLHLLDCLNPGGTETQLLGLLRSLDPRHVRSLVAVLHEDGALVGEVEAMGVSVRAFPLRRRLVDPNTAIQIARIALHCRGQGVDLVHAHDFYANLVAASASRLAGARFVASRRDLANALSPMKRRVLGLSCRSADRVIANARSVALLDEDGLHLPPSRVEVVHNGIDLAAFDAAAAPAPVPAIDLLDAPADRAPCVVVVANMNLPDKGQADLLEAAAICGARGLLLRLIFVGDGPQRARLEALTAAHRLGARTRFVGRRRDVPRIVARASALCLPSWAEGFPNAVMEGMAAGLPVVATRVGGCPELVDDGVTGLLVPPRDPAALADALTRLASDRAASLAMGQRAREAISARYSLRASALRFEQLYERVVGERLP